MTTLLKAGVAGAGVFGGFHARKFASLPDVQLAAVFDLDSARAEALANELGARAFTDLDAFLEAAADVVTVASPAVTHGDIAARALGAGRHVYVEKPLAVDLDEARVLVGQARDAGRVLVVGHQERAVFRAIGLFDVPERPIAIEAVRLGTPGERNLDVSVILDLMIHDLDLALALIGAEADGVQATGSAPVGPFTDDCEAEVFFEDGAAASFSASRVAEARERTMRIEYPSGELVIDFLARTFENRTPFKLHANFADTTAGKDPLGASVSDFLAAVRGDIPRPLVTGEEALAALDLALRIDAAVSGD
jgi:predicted dehydrogenase